MKLSIAWIFDHIDADWKEFNVDDIIDKFNKKIAEIETFKRVNTNLDDFSLAEVTKVTDQDIGIYSTEWDKDLKLPLRKDVGVGHIYMIKKYGAQYSWATMQDFHSSKVHNLPQFICQSEHCSGKWKENFETDNVKTKSRKFLTLTLVCWVR